jgi:hypothetical protein
MPLTQAFAWNAIKQLRIYLTAVYTWWINELLDIAPFIRKTTEKRRQIQKVSLNNQRYELALWRDGAWHPTAYTSTENPFQEAVLTLLKNCSQANGTLLIELPFSSMLHRRLSLPLSMRRKFNKIAQLQIEHWTPFKIEDVYFVLSSSDLTHVLGQINCDLILCRRAFADEIFEATKGFSVNRVDLITPDSKITIASSARQGVAVTASKSTRIIIIFSIIIFIANAISAIALYSKQKEIIKSGLTEIAAQVKLAEELQSTLETKISTASLVARLIPKVNDASIFSSISSFLPKTSWVLQYRRQSDKVQIIGFAEDSSHIVQKLSSTSEFHNVQLRTAQRPSGEEREHFDVTFQLVPEH